MRRDLKEPGRRKEERGGSWTLGGYLGEREREVRKK